MIDPAANAMANAKLPAEIVQYLETEIAFRDSAVIRRIRIVSFSPAMYLRLGTSEALTLLSSRR